MKEKTGILRKAIFSPYLIWMVIFIIVPLVMVIYYAFTDGRGDFSLQNIPKLADYSDTFLLSLWLAVIATAICLLLAYPIAYLISRSSSSAQRTLLMLVMLPMWTNFLLRTYSLMTIISDEGLINKFLNLLNIPSIHIINTNTAVVIGMVYNFLPFMIMPLYSVMTKIDNSVIEAAQDLGGSSISLVTKILIPLSVPGIVSGITMVFVPSLSTFYISQKLGGTTTLIGDVIEEQFMHNHYNVGATISLVLMIIVLICMLIMGKVTKNDGEVSII